MYVGSKHAVEGITKSAALELAGTGVRVNVSSGQYRNRNVQALHQHRQNKAAIVSTVPVKRMGMPEEIAHVIAFVRF